MLRPYIGKIGILKWIELMNRFISHMLSRNTRLVINVSANDRMLIKTKLPGVRQNTTYHRDESELRSEIVYS